MDKQVALALFGKILVAYPETPCRATQENIIEGLATGNYVCKVDGDSVQWFAAYWLVHVEDIDGIKERIKPSDRITGSSCYVAEAVNSRGRRGMREMIAAIRDKCRGGKGVIWHRPKRGDRINHYPSQRGGDHGIE